MRCWQFVVTGEARLEREVLPLQPVVERVVIACW